MNPKTRKNPGLYCIIAQRQKEQRASRREKAQPNEIGKRLSRVLALPINTAW